MRDGSRMLAVKADHLSPRRAGADRVRRFQRRRAGHPQPAVRVDPLPGEKIAGNNSLTRVVDVPRKRRRILYVEGEPRWEYKFIRRAVDARSQRATGDDAAHFAEQVLPPGRRSCPTNSSDGFPVKPEELFAFDALILGSIEAAYFTPEQQDMIKEFVNLRGGTLLMLGGRHGLADGGWGTSKVAEALPVELSTGDATTFVREKAPVELTVQGARFADLPLRRRSGKERQAVEGDARSRRLPAGRRAEARRGRTARL